MTRKQFKDYFLRFVLPIVVISIFFLIRIYWLDGVVNLQAFSLITIFVAIFSAFGGFISGLITILFSTIIATYLYIEPIYSFETRSSQSIQRILIYVVSAVIVALFISAFAENRRLLRKKTIELDKTTKRIRRIMDSIFTMVTIMDRTGNIKETNKSYADSLGLTIETVVNKNIFDFEPWSQDKDLQANLKTALQSVNPENPVKFEYRIMVDDEEYYAEVSVNMIKNNKHEEIVMAVRDRTDRRKYENELLKSQQILSRLIDSNVIGMAVSDLKGEFIETNDSFLDMLGYTPKEFIENGLSWKNVTPEEYQALDIEKLEELTNKGYVSLFEKEYFHKDGHRISVIQAGVRINPEHVLVLILDLTPQKTLQQKKDEFISIASHELKTPMTVIKGYLQLLSKRLAQTEENYDEFIGIIDFQLNKLNTLVNELHDMTKISSNKLKVHLEDTNLNTLVINSIKEVEPFTNSHNLKFEEKQKDIVVQADIIRLEQVLLNLLTNAIKYSPDGGDVITSLYVENGNAVISVKDYGLGIPENKIKDIFKKFFQVEESVELREGLGLGLYISSEIIKLHNGTITVESKEAEGSTFIVTIPLT